MLLAFASKPGLVWATVGAVAGVIIGFVAAYILEAVERYNSWEYDCRQKKNSRYYRSSSRSDRRNKYWNEYWHKHVYVELAITVGVAIPIALLIAGISGFARTGATSGAVVGAWILAVSAVTIIMLFDLDFYYQTPVRTSLGVIGLVVIAFVLAIAVTGIMAGIGTQTITLGWAIVRALAWALAGILPVAGFILDLYAADVLRYELNVNNYKLLTWLIFSATSFLGLGLGWLAGSIFA